MIYTVAEKAYITPNVLKWARESAHMTLGIAAAKVNVSPARLAEWEEGKDQPTIRQAETLAKAYRRPFALFFLPEIPRDFLPLQDFRRQNAGELGTASVFIIREIQQKQAWISEVNEEGGGEPLTFIGKYTISDDPGIVAKDILSTLNIDPLAYSTDKPIKEWIDKAESKGIFISRTSFIHSRLTLDSDEMQGFTIADRFAPFVFLNSEDWDAPQLFTLVHELAHLWIAASGISNDIAPEINKGKLHPVELFCNEVAANALMPAQVMDLLDNYAFSSSAELFRAARKLGVSSFALLVRGFNLRRISLIKYAALRRDAENDFQLFLQKEKEKKEKQKLSTGGPNPYLLRLNKNSRLFTQIVLDAFHGGRIAATQASSLLNTKVNNFHKLETILYT